MRFFVLLLIVLLMSTSFALDAPHAYNVSCAVPANQKQRILLPNRLILPSPRERQPIARLLGMLLRFRKIRLTPRITGNGSISAVQITKIRLTRIRVTTYPLGHSSNELVPASSCDRICSLFF